MKPHFVFFILFAYATILYSQSKNVAIANEKMNVIYIGVENPIKIVAEKYSCNSLVVVPTSNVISFFGDSCDYKINPLTPGVLSFKVYSVINKDSVFINEIEFRVKRIPQPIALIGNQSGGGIIVSKFKISKSIVAKFECFDFDLPIHIISFQARITKNNEVVYDEINNGSMFSENLKKHIDLMTLGDVIEFLEIKASYSNTNATLNPISLKLY